MINLIKKQFENQNYINIETFRMNGQGVKTPVWFVQDDGSLYVRTAEGSGKVKEDKQEPPYPGCPMQNGWDTG